jgi:antibiotic biosynthesis monooxygenase (ABM) superfamily enzyme
MDNTELYIITLVVVTILGLIVVPMVVLFASKLLKPRYKKYCELTGKREEFD